MPFEYWIGRLSEEFGGCLPSVLMAEANRLPAGMLDTIIEDRLMVRAIDVYQQNPKATGALVQLVREVEFEDVQEAIYAEQLHDHD